MVRIEYVAAYERFGQFVVSAETPQEQIVLHWFLHAAEHGMMPTIPCGAYDSDRPGGPVSFNFGWTEPEKANKW